MQGGNEGGNEGGCGAKGRSDLRSSRVPEESGAFQTAEFTKDFRCRMAATRLESMHGSKTYTLSEFSDSQIGGMPRARDGIRDNHIRDRKSGRMAVEQAVESETWLTPLHHQRGRQESHDTESAE